MTADELVNNNIKSMMGRCRPIKSATKKLKIELENTYPGREAIIIHPKFADRLIKEGALMLHPGERHYHYAGAKVFISADAGEEEVLIY